MNLKEFDKLQNKEVRNQIAIDFDGVIHKSSKGFGDGGVYDPPTNGTIEALEWFKEKGYTVVLHTAKVNPDRPLVDGRTGEELITEWLKQFEIDHLVDHITCIKPRAYIYIDDRGLRFESWEQTLNDFKTIVSNDPTQS